MALSNIMSFVKMTAQPYPPRLWTIVGYPGSGKSTFATQMRKPILAVDADQRFNEVLHLAKDDVYSLSATPADHTNTERIAAILDDSMPGGNIQTIVVDSLTAIITPLVTQAMLDNEAGRNRNRAAAFKQKALAMRKLQDAVTKWGKDVLWIYHMQDGRDGRGKRVTRATLPQTEQVRLERSINLRLEAIIEGGKRGVKVRWARRGRQGMTLWDESGTWLGIPERIEAAVYDGLARGEQDLIEQGFASIETALTWAMDRGAFKEKAGARSAYDEVKRENLPQNASEMAQHWVNAVLKRLEAMQA